MLRHTGSFLIVMLMTPVFAFSQAAVGLKAGLNQSFPLAQRDSFAGSPAPFATLTLVLPINKRITFNSSLSYNAVKLSNRWDATGFRWQTLGLGAGIESGIPRMERSFLYAGLNVSYVTGFGKNVLSQNASSGTTYVNRHTDQLIIPSAEAGISFQAKSNLNFSLGVSQPVYSIRSGNYSPSFPGSVRLGLEYRISFHDISHPEYDTSGPEKRFCYGLKYGTLYVIEDRTDSSHRLVREMLNSHYHFGKTGFVPKSRVSEFLDSISHTGDTSRVYFARIGSIVYDRDLPSTYGLIIYDYRMQQPVPGEPFFIRNLTGDLDFEDPLVVKKVIKTMNDRLFKMYKMYAK